MRGGIVFDYLGSVRSIVADGTGLDGRENCYRAYTASCGKK